MCVSYTFGVLCFSYVFLYVIAILFKYMILQANNNTAVRAHRRVPHAALREALLYKSAPTIEPRTTIQCRHWACYSLEFRHQQIGFCQRLIFQDLSSQ